MARMKSRVAPLIYGFARKISHETGEYRVSIERIAKYFDLSPKAVRSAHAELVEAGWFTVYERGHYSPTVYTLIRDHKEWIEGHSGQCCNRVQEPWTTQNDSIAQHIHARTRATVKPKPYHVRILRSLMDRFGDGEEQIVTAFNNFYANYGGDGDPMIAFIKHYRTNSAPGNLRLSNSGPETSVTDVLRTQ
jgi:hypothetical protein